MINDETTRLQPVAAWLFIMAAMIAVMVTIGGATRLTDSGLSITEWDLVSGAVPPLSDAAWDEAFAEYKTTTEYQTQNRGMAMADFKTIFWWEWGHRQLGRVIGLGFLLPLAWWSFRGRVTGGLRYRLWGLFALVCLQGAIGWFMVASGLTGRTDVSQYRLALHLTTAFTLFGLTVWQALALAKPRAPLPLSGATESRWLPIASVGLLALTGMQVVLGAFVAGLRAGKDYTDWPLMGGEFFPSAYFTAGASSFSDAFENIAAVQFNHRIGAYVLFSAALAFAVATWRQAGPVRRLGLYVASGVSLQAMVGIWTLVAAVPMWLGLVHQLGALALLALLVFVSYQIIPHRLPARSAPEGLAAAA